MIATYKMVGGYDEVSRYWEHEIGPGQWFVRDYFLYVKLAWTTLQIHVGDVDADETASLKFRIEVPRLSAPDGKASVLHTDMTRLDPGREHQ